MQIMRVTNRTNVVTAAGGTAETIGPDVQILQVIGPGEINPTDDRPQAAGLLKPQRNVALIAAVRSRGATGRVFNAGKNKLLAPKSNRLLYRSIFCLKNAPFRKLSSRSNKDTSPIRCSAWRACFWSVQSAIASGLAPWIITR
jgi:hypothetical protein